MPRIPILLLAIMLCPALLVSARGQSLLTADDKAKIAPLLDTSAPNSLKCIINEWKPTLDFALRFVPGYIVFCPVSQFEGKQTIVFIYVRVTPQGREPTLLGSAHRVPELPPDMRRSAGDFKKLKNDVGMSGAFGVGEGDYTVEVLVIDDQKRTCRKRWKIHAATNRSQRKLSLAIQPLTVEMLDRKAWQIAPPQEHGLRLTVLLDAAPINHYQSSLRAWDRAVLLQSLYSLLRQTPYKSARLVAFNLDQQRELYREDHFDSAAFLTLSHALQEIETATVSVQALKKSTSAEFLAALANQELAADSSDAIIFLGPNARLDVKLSGGALIQKKPASPPFFYFEYFAMRGAEFPDSIQSLMSAANGKTFVIHSPAELDQSIQKMLAQLKQQ